jgi:hypothetical protein
VTATLVPPAIAAAAPAAMIDFVDGDGNGHDASATGITVSGPGLPTGHTVEALPP